MEPRGQFLYLQNKRQSFLKGSNDEIKVGASLPIHSSLESIQLDCKFSLNCIRGLMSVSATAAVATDGLINYFCVGITRRFSESISGISSKFISRDCLSRH